MVAINQLLLLLLLLVYELPLYAMTAYEFVRVGRKVI